jgi:hypothetical protein
MQAIKTKMHQRLQALSTAGQPAAKHSPSIPEAIEQRLIELIVTPVPSTETALAGNARKEREIAEVLASLTVIEAWWLHKRLTIASPSDALVAAFGRLVVERRQRLLAFLGDARRRAAMTRKAA